MSNFIALLSISRILSTNFKCISLATVFIGVFYKFLIKPKQVFSSFETIHRQFLWHCSYKVVNIPIYQIWKFFFWIKIFHVLVVSSFILIYNMTHSTSDAFDAINRDQSVILVLLLYFSGMPGMIILRKKCPYLELFWSAFSRN